MKKNNLLIKKSICMAVAFLLIGCASRESYDSTMKSMVGKSYSAVIDVFGRPSVEYTLNGNLYLTYQQADLGVAGAPPMITGQDSNSVFHEGSEGQTFYKKWCQTTFILRNGIVASFQSKGNNCRR